MVYRTAQGKEIDLEKLMKQNELMPAIGNMKVNARGDELGPGGKIIRKREDIVADYYDTNPNAAPRRKAKIEEVQDPEIKPQSQIVKTKKSTPENTEE